MMNERSPTPRIALSQVSVEMMTSSATKQILRNISLEINPGEVVAVCGVSGAGKSTLLRVMAGLQPVSGGQVTIDGSTITGVPAGIGFVVQDYSRSLFPWFSVGRNLSLAIRKHSYTKEDIRDLVGSALSQVGLAGHERSRLWQLSGGMQQRVAIARALLGNTRILLMDEPFASVDAQVRQDLEDLTLRLTESSGITTVVVTHDIDEAVYMADRVLVIGGEPGTLIDKIPITLPRPRSQLDTREHPDFGTFRRRVTRAMWPARSGEAPES